MDSGDFTAGTLPLSGKSAAYGGLHDSPDPATTASEETLMERLRQMPVIGWLLRVHERFGEVRGTSLANGIALQTFLSIFPLLLVGIAVVGFLSAGDPSFTKDLIENLELDGEAAEQISTAISNAEDSRQAASVIGVAGLLWSGLSLVLAFQRSIDSAWQSFGKGILEKVRALAWLLGAVIIFLASFAVTAVINFLPGFLAPVSVLVGVAVNVGLFVWTFSWLGRLPIGVKAVLPGAMFCAVGFEILKVIGSVYVPRLMANSEAMYGSLGIVFAIIAWLALFGRLIVYGSVVNVLAYEDANGTVEIPIAAPRVDDALALASDRSGRVVDRLSEPNG